MNPKFLLLMSFLSFFGCGKKAPEYPADTLTTRDGTQITLTFFKHASLAIEAGGKCIYVDPVSGYADYAALPKADVVLITHSHYDHLDVAAVEAIQTPQTEILCDRTSAEAFEMNCYTMRPGSVATPRDYLKVEAVAAYNTTDGHLQFHPKDREDCGYILTLGGSRIYIAGDTEPTPELKALKNIDIAFLPVNQPYTMTVDQAVEAVKESGAVALFAENSNNSKSIEAIARGAGVTPIVGDDALYGDSLGPEGSAGATYVGSIIHNVRTLTDAWGGTVPVLPDRLAGQ